jgi:hypothetical protein
VRVEYEGAGLVEILLPNEASLGTFGLDDVGFMDVVQMKCNQTSPRVGITIRPYSGQPIISMVELDYVPRSQIRKKDARRGLFADFQFTAGQPQLNIDVAATEGQLALDDELNGDINVDDVALGPSFPVLGETDAAVTLDIPEAASLVTFSFIGGDIIMDTSPAGPASSLVTYDPLADETYVDDALSGPSVLELGEDAGSITLDVGG